jgi:Ca-dependent carbohydrate-binding module xylan-binding
MPSLRSGTRTSGWTAAIAAAACFFVLVVSAVPVSAHTRSHAAGVQTMQTASKARAAAQRAVNNAVRALKRCERGHRHQCGHERRVLKRARARLVRAERRLSALARQQTKPAPVSTQSDTSAAQTATQVAGFEAESMTIPSNSDIHSFNDSLASAGKALSFPGNGAVTKTVTSGTATTLTVRARGDQCNGAPKMLVLVDGRTAMSVGVSATSWTDYSAAISLAAGSHKFSIQYANDYVVKGVCDRNLRADKVSLQTSTTATTGTTTGTSTGTTTTSPLPAPTVTVSGQTLNWTAVAGASSYIVAAKQSGVADQYTQVTGTSFTPPAVPGATLQYSVRAAADGSIWSAPVSISYPASQPAPSPTSGSMIVGLNGANYGTTGVNDVKNAVGYTRLDNGLSTTTFANYESAGVKVEVDFSGPYNTGGVSALNPTTWASNALSWYGANCATDRCPVIEVLNEPWWPKWWGTNAGSQANADAYARLLKATWEAFHSRYGASAPKILASCEDQSWNSYWCDEWRNSGAVSNPLQYVDGVTVHPYGGTSNRTQSALGSTAEVTTAHSVSGKPVYVTEIGWPTATQCSSTGDSFQWSETDQATNITNFVEWARSTGYVAAVMYFNYHDFGSCDWYGVVRSDGTRKPGYYALQAEAAK